MNLKDYIIDVKDFPKKGIVFKDITPLLNNSEAFNYAVNQISEFVKESRANVVVAPEARGFLFASAVAYASKTRFVLIRKPNKLPREVIDIEYELEYGTNHLQIHKQDLKKGDRVVIIDDVLATGGTAKAIIKLLKKEEIEIAGISFLIDLKDIHEPGLLEQYNLQKLLIY